MIYIKAYFGKWKETTKQEAKIFCDKLINRMQAVRGIEKRIELINKNHLKGITYEEL